MHHWLLAATLILAAEGVALACSCVAPGGAEEARRHARELVKEAVAIAEVQVVSGYDHRARRGEQVRVRRLFFGRVPATFRIERRARPSSAACELELNTGERRVLVLYRPKSRQARGAQYRTHGLCSDYLILQPYLPIVLQEARQRMVRRAG